MDSRNLFMIDFIFHSYFIYFCFGFNRAALDLHPKSAALSKKARNIKPNTGTTETTHADDSIDSRNTNIIFNATDSDLV